MKLYFPAVYLIFLLVGSAQNNAAFAQGMPDAEITADDAGAKEETAPGQTTAIERLEPVIQIKRLETEEPLYSFELREVEIGDLFRVLAHDYMLNLLVDKEVQGRVTASLTNVSLEEALNSIAESLNLKLEKKGNIIWLSRNLITRVFKLKYLKASDVVDSSNSAKSSSETIVPDAGN